MNSAIGFSIIMDIKRFGLLSATRRLEYPYPWSWVVIPFYIFHNLLDVGLFLGWIFEVKSARCIINVAGPYMLTQGELMTLGTGQTGVEGKK